jgi:hypothetical protein
LKWKAKGNLNQNQNQNVHTISVEKHNEGPRIIVLTGRGSRTGDDMKNGGKHIEKWVRNSVGPMPNFYPRQEKETYQTERK